MTSVCGKRGLLAWWSQSVGKEAVSAPPYFTCALQEEESFTCALQDEASLTCALQEETSWEKVVYFDIVLYNQT